MTTLTQEARDYALWCTAMMTTGSTGGLDRPPAVNRTGGWWRPSRVALDAEALVWEPGTLEPTALEPDMLTDFVELVDGAGEDILAFAQAHGVLLAEEVLGYRTEVRESLDEWRALARHFRALLTIGASLHLDEAIDESAWSAASTSWARLEPIDDAVRFWRRSELAVPRGSEITTDEHPADALVLVLREWMHRAPSPTQVTRSDDRLFELELEPASLVAALVLQTALAVARTEGLAICSGCGRPYAPKRRPAPGRRRYCEECGRAAARREASRAYRARQKGASK